MGMVEGITARATVRAAPHPAGDFLDNMLYQEYIRNLIENGFVLQKVFAREEVLEPR
jgi:hypothetical protein